MEDPRPSREAAAAYPAMDQDSTAKTRERADLHGDGPGCAAPAGNAEDPGAAASRTGPSPGVARANRAAQRRIRSLRHPARRGIGEAHRGVETLARDLAGGADLEAKALRHPGARH